MPYLRERTLWRLCTAALLLHVSFCAGESASYAQEVSIDYTTQVKPLLAEKCYSCHGRLKQESGLRIDTRSLMVDAEVIVPGRAAESELFRRIVSKDDDQRMPPPSEGSALKPKEVDVLRQWIDQGAIAPVESIPQSPLEHWAFQPIERPEVPKSKHSHPVDAFLDEKRASVSLQTQPQAERGILLRRLHLDLIGLPPSLEQLRDERPWEEIVDELLTSPHHGERWGRHWMDVWRYSDWYGLGAQLRYSQKHIWHWRDWIIESLNADKGYDQMIREMLAADEISPLDRDALRATGFLARNYYLFNRTTWLDSTIEHTGKAFLGLTLNCAKCHDHKYDPITHLDYYQMRAIFEPHQVRLDPVPGETDFEKDGLPRVFDNHVDARTFVHLRGNPKTPDKETPVRPRVPEFLADFQDEVTAIALPYQAYAPGARNYVQRDRLREANSAVEKAQQLLQASKPDAKPALKAKLAVAQAKLAALTATIAAEKAKFASAFDKETARLLEKTAAILQAEERIEAAKLNVLVVDEKKKQAAEKELIAARAKLAKAVRGEISYRPIRGAKKALESPAHKETDYSETYSASSTGRRTALANWITSRKNPLTARVAVNHVWMRHFGQPLVESVFDFGLRCPRPVNAELLDYLASEFMDSGWSFRHLHRLIVTSKTYQLSSSSINATENTLAADSNNRFYWRMNGRRMESQVVRDSLLSLAGQLDTKMGGPSVDANKSSNRRSVYFKHSRDDQNKFLKTFNDADLFQCYRRSESIVPQQALALANSQLSMQMAEKIAARVVGLSEDNTKVPRDVRSEKAQDVLHVQIENAFRLFLARPATEEETVESLRFFKEMSSIDNPPDQPTQFTRFIHALLNHNDFITIR